MFNRDAALPCPESVEFSFTLAFSLFFSSVKEVRIQSTATLEPRLKAACEPRRNITLWESMPRHGLSTHNSSGKKAAGVSQLRASILRLRKGTLDASLLNYQCLLKGSGWHWRLEGVGQGDPFQSFQVGLLKI